MVAALRVLADLGAQHAAGVRVVWVALYARGHAIDHGGAQRAGVRTVVGAGAGDGGDGGVGECGHGGGERGEGVIVRVFWRISPRLPSYRLAAG